MVISSAIYENWYIFLRIVHSLFSLLVFSGVSTDLKLCILFKTDHFRAIPQFMLYSIFLWTTGDDIASVHIRS